MLKHRILLLTIALIIAQLSFSQSKWNIGLNIGPNISSFRGESNGIFINPDFGLAFGSSVAYNFNESSSLRLDILFESKNSKTNLEDPNNPNLSFRNNSKFIFKYSTFALLYRHRLGVKKDFFINAGPFFSALTKTKIKINGETTSEGDNDQLFTNTDLGLSFGIGNTIIKNESLNLSLELRNSLGLKNISKVPFEDNGELRTNSVLLILNLELFY